ncbi:heavy metal-associated isoprenylated plant protein 16-like [Ipomoea triloba]|uniref:heavy metal-associated isoprenylated plant protein 16-like n=1 Tax=Ipomoea triloba TaxID=35885 RepID=UPI00125E3592|nr:heavy metal-associated isoprenylated plant protein 16-like [Ipomoea triloba]
MIISLPLNNPKCRAKAMKIASIAGVISVAIDADKNQLTVTGDGVDFLELMNFLRRKFKCASIISLEDVKPPAPPPPPAPQPSSPTKGKCSSPCPCPCPPDYSNPCVQYYPLCEPVYDSYPNCNCSIQ